MAFDISTANPVAQDSGSVTTQDIKTGFDISTAKPFDLEKFSAVDFGEPGYVPQHPQNKSNQNPLTLATEAAAGFNRALFGIVDFIGPDTVNAISEIVGSKMRMPTMQKTFGAEKGQYAGDGLGTDIASTAGEFAGANMVGGALLRSAAGALPAFSQAESPVIGSIRQLGQTKMPTDLAVGAASGAGAAGGREVGGEPGAAVGALAAPLASVAAFGGAKSLIEALSPKFGKNITLIDQKTGLPVPAFQKALESRGLDYGSIIDGVSNLPVVSTKRSLPEIVDSIVTKKIKSGSGDQGLAALRLEQGRVVADDLGAEAVKQGFKPGQVAVAKNADNATKAEMLKMLNIRRQIAADDTAALSMRPSDIAGDHVLNRFNFIRDKANGLRLQLDAIAKGSAPSIGERYLPGPGIGRGLKGAEIDTSNIENTVLQGLGKLNINIPDEVFADTTKLQSFLRNPESFVGSQISKDKTSQKVIKDTIDLLSEPGSDALRAHNLKRQLDAMIDFRKQSQGGLTEAGRTFAKTVRHALNESIREISPAYARVNDDLSLALKTMESFQNSISSKIDLFSDTSSGAVGQELRKLLSNYASRQTLRDSLSQIDSTTKALGGHFEVDAPRLVQFASTLDERFPAVARNSMQGVLEKGINNANSPQDIHKSFIREGFKKGVEKAQGVNDTNAYNAMTKILRRKESR
jgi:hypothetical protein